LKGKYTPGYFLSDYDKTYPVVIKEIITGIIIMKDFVHAVRQIYRELRTALNKVEVKGIEKVKNKAVKKKIINLKKRLLAKQANKVLYKMRKGFKGKYAEVGGIYLEGGVEELKELSNKFPSLTGFYEKTKRFVNTYLDTWVMQMEKGVKEGIPTSSNIIESKNSIFKAFSKKAKCYESTESMECFFSAVAIMQNFDVKKRGENKGTSAIMRAGINLEEFGARDFFEAVGLAEIVLKDIGMSECISDYPEIRELVA
jgi:hypothetical protein